MRSFPLISILLLNACVPDYPNTVVPSKSKVCDYIINTEKATVCGLAVGTSENGFQGYFGIENIEKILDTGINSPYAFCYRLKDEPQLTFCFDEQAVWYRTYSNSSYIRTSRDVKIGDSETIPIQRYGEPTSKYRHQNDCCDIYEYSLPGSILFSFVASEGVVRSLSLDRISELQ